jgi:hypothetical protein
MYIGFDIKASADCAKICKSERERINGKVRQRKSV